MAYGLDVTDLIYADSNLVDIGTLDDYDIDLDLAGQKDFTLSTSDYILRIGDFWYVDNTEYGGIVDGFETEEYSVRYTGRSFRGILASKIIYTEIDPDPEDDVVVGKTVAGDINRVVNELISEYDMDWLFVCDYPDIDDITKIETDEESPSINIGTYTIQSGTNLYDAIDNIAYSINFSYIFKYTAIDKHIHIIPILAKDYTDEMIYGKDDVAKFKVDKNEGYTNHLICSGLDQNNRTVRIHLFTDSNGAIQPYAKNNDDFLWLDTANAPTQDSDYILDESSKVITGIKEIVEYMDQDPQVSENYDLVTEAPNDWSMSFGYYYTKEVTEEQSLDFTGHEVETRQVDGILQAVESYPDPFFGSCKLTYKDRKAGIKENKTEEVYTFKTASDMQRILEVPWFTYRYKYKYVLPVYKKGGVPNVPTKYNKNTTSLSNKTCVVWWTVSSSKTEVPNPERWLLIKPDVPAGKYLWVKNVYKTGEVNYFRNEGALKEKLFAVGDNQQDIPSGPWLNVIPIVPSGKYLWMRCEKVKNKGKATEETVAYEYYSKMGKYSNVYYLFDEEFSGVQDIMTQINLDTEPDDTFGLYYQVYDGPDEGTNISVFYSNEHNNISGTQNTLTVKNPNYGVKNAPDTNIEYKDVTVTKDDTYNITLHGGSAIITASVVTTTISWEPVKALEVDSYLPLEEEPANWATSYSKYYTRSWNSSGDPSATYYKTTDTVVNPDKTYFVLSGDKFIPVQNPVDESLPDYYECTMDLWEYSSVSGESVIDYENWKKNWTQITSIPSDWTKNYGQYYYAYEDGKLAGDEVQQYSGVSEDEYVVMTVQPTDWTVDKGYKNYYKKNGKKYKKNGSKKFKPNTYYIKESITLPPEFKPTNCWLPTSTTIPPEFVAGSHFVHKYVASVPPFVSDKYYRKLEDNYAELVRSGISHLEELRSGDSQNIEITDMELNIGDIVGGVEEMTNTMVTQAITNKIIKMNNGVVYSEYEVG